MIYFINKNIDFDILICYNIYITKIRRMIFSMNKNVHIISHSHWDREWYLPFEEHRMRLVELIDKCMEIFEKDDSFKSFFLDGQTIVLDDYLEIRPQNKEKLIKYIKEGRFVIGPWYILQDEFYTSGEANIRNLLVGMEESKKYGAMCNMGYFPDAFGNAGQMPQILNQAGMDAITFGRGVRPVGFDNEVQENGSYESPYSEMLWESPDGTKILGILFANWYNNGNEIPTDKETARAYWDDRLKKVAAFASTNEYLMMNGCDHQPVQADLVKAIETASELYPDINFKHSSFPEYIDAIKSELPDDLAVVKGELTSQDTDGWTTLINCASSHVYLKQMNRRCESALENGAEPVRVLSSLLGQSYPADELTYSWKTLMQNHPHDSICCCSVDEIQDEMLTRFNKSKQVADYLIFEGKSYIAGKINTAEFEKYSGAIPFVLFNTTGRKRTSVVSVELDAVRKSGRLVECAYDIDEVILPEYKLIDSDGNSIAFKIEDLGVHFDYTLPKDKFRQPYMSRRVRITFEAEDIPAVGYRTYALIEGEGKKINSTLVSGANCMENDAIRVVINEDGSLDLTDKASGNTYEGIAYYEDTGDLGNEYMYKMPNGSEAITTKGTAAQIELVEDQPYKAVYKVTNTMVVPASGDEFFEDEKRHMVPYKERMGGRSGETVELKLVKYVSLDSSGKGVKIKTVFDNTAKDHRVRIMIPTRINSEVHKADSVFEAATRNNRHSAVWENPSACEHEQAFVSIDDGSKGIAVANIGLYEYEMLPELDNTIAVTILRAVGEMGDWGVFPTPKAQCLGMSETEIEIVPFKGDFISSGAYEECYRFRTDIISVDTDCHKGDMPLDYSMVEWSGDGLTLTGIKQKEAADDMILRWVNLSDKAAALSIKKTDVINNLYISNVIEKMLDKVESDGGYFNIEVKPYEILTVGVSKN